MKDQAAGEEGKQHSYVPSRCPICGSDDYISGAMGGRCLDCGYSIGFHGTGEFQRNG